MKRTLLTMLSLCIALLSFGQTDWSKVDFTSEYKGKVKIGGAASKALKENKTFVNAFTVSQATLMKGSETTATKGVFSEVSLAGIDNDLYQKMVDELYQSFIQELEEAGLDITSGDEFIASDLVQNNLSKIKKNEIIGPIGNNTMIEGKKKVTEGAMPGYGAWAVTADVTFFPKNVNVYTNDSYLQVGNFFMKPAPKEKTNLLSVKYYVAFASFDGKKGYKDISLATNPVLSVSVNVQLTTVNLSGNEISYSKMPIWGSSDWSEGIVKGKDNRSDAEFLGLALSADYEITADPEKYISEVKAIISNLQKDIISGIKSSL
ncbi:hypothetical protein [Algoriphagus formosus]|uniref:hypothetical protein n=1 Tax=Algoriphagus formosus TaxID=2007308 RepID=UPI003F6FF923